MKRHELEHIIRAAGAITGSKDIYIIGSQALLGAFPDLPDELTVSQEADVWPSEDPGKSDLIDGTIGELSPFHETFGYYAHGIGPQTALLPENWKERAVLIANNNTNGYRGICLHPLDIAISKIAAGRPKDLEYVDILLTRQLVDRSRIRQIVIDELPQDTQPTVLDRFERIAGKTEDSP